MVDLGIARTAGNVQQPAIAGCKADPGARRNRIVDPAGKAVASRADAERSGGIGRIVLRTFDHHAHHDVAIPVIITKPHAIGDIIVVWRARYCNV